MVERYPNLKEEVGGSIPGCEISSQISKKKLAVRFLALKSPLYLMENLPGGQLPPVLWRWPVSLLSQKRKERLRCTLNIFQNVFFSYSPPTLTGVDQQ